MPTARSVWNGTKMGSESQVDGGEDENCSMAWEFGLLEKILFAQMTLLYPTGKGTDGLKRQRLCSDPFKLSWFLHRESL